MSGAFSGILRFELGYHFRRISTYVYFGIFLALSFFMINAIGGAWESVNMAVGGSSGTVKVNSPYVLAVVSNVVALFSVLVTAALLGNAVYRDFETGMHPLFFTTPVSKRAYLGGRFTAAFLVNAFILLSIPVGLAIGSVMPYLDRHRFGPMQPIAFVHPYLVLILPNLLFTGAVFFALAAMTRQMLPNYMGGAIMLVGYLLAGNLTRDLENQRIAALLDPFGGNAYQFITKYWTPAERNATLVALQGDFLFNRLLWLVVGCAILAIAFARFRFSHASERKRWFGRRRAPLADVASDAPVRPLHVPTPTRSFSAAAHLQQYVSITARSFWSIVGNRYFFAIVGAGLLFLVFSANQVGKLYGTTTFPVTYEVLEVLGGTFAIFVLIVITFYAGDLVWRERDTGVHQVHDTMPVPNWVPFAAKFTALVLMVAVLQVVILIAGVVTQAVQGYTRFELGLYAKTLFGLHLADYVLLVALVMLVQVLVNHKYMGHLIVVLYFVFAEFMPQLGLEHGLYQYGSDAGNTYSDMNRFGPFLTPFWWFKAYWAAWAVLFALLSNVFWVRGQEMGAKWRGRMARRRFGRSQWIVTAAAAMVIVALGGFIFYNTNILNDYRTEHEEELTRAEYERQYKQYEHLPQPRMTGVRVDVDLFPHQPSVALKGEQRFANRATVPIEAIHVRVPPEATIRRLEFSVPARQAQADATRGYYIYTLDRPLQPGDEGRLVFDLVYESAGFENRISNTQVVENGTFVNSTIMPAFGYEPRFELSEDTIRRKHDLQPKERMPSLDDEDARRNNYISVDADWVEFETTVSTSPDQMALAPGYLQRE
jgi:ABC-type transport system involved in multi-copper enzyme maturation permease subunit